MAEIVLQATNDDQIQNELDTSLALQPMDNILEERIDLSENEGYNVDSENFDRGNDAEISRQIKAEGLEAFQTPRQVPEQIDINLAIGPVNTTPVARNLQHIESRESALPTRRPNEFTNMANNNKNLIRKTSGIRIPTPMQHERTTCAWSPSRVLLIPGTWTVAPGTTFRPRLPPGRAMNAKMTTTVTANTKTRTTKRKMVVAREEMLQEVKLEVITVRFQRKRWTIHRHRPTPRRVIHTFHAKKTVPLNHQSRHPMELRWPG